MKNGELINDYFPQTLTIANKMRMYGEKSMTLRYDYIVCSIEESHNLDSMTIDELQNSLLVHEQRMKCHNSHEEQAFKVAQDEASIGCGRGRNVFRGGVTRGRGRSRGGRQPINRTTIQCYYCREFGHFQSECLKKPQDSKSNYVEGGEEAVLLMTQHSTDDKSNAQKMWFIDSSCSNHVTMKLGNNYVLKVAGKVMHLVNDVFYVSELKNNLFSMSQFLEKGLSIEMKENKYKVFQGENLIFETFMTTNRMFAISLKFGLSRNCFNSMPSTQVWHSRYGHLNYNGLKTLLGHDMVKGLPTFKSPTQLCEHCLKGKHQRDPFPQQNNWHAS
ncbi:hypothetical protein CR513_44654, partial [Mucuna pruriens]